jgi:hypothetical protein
MATEQSDAVEVVEEDKFDPRKHMGSIRTRQGNQKYLAVKWRLLWLRSEHPDAQVITEKVAGGVEYGWVEFKCTITYIMETVVGIDGGVTYIDLPSKYEDRVLAVGTGHGSETKEDFPDFLEKAETKAVGRACAVLGYGTDAAPDLDDDEPVDGLPAAKQERHDRRRAAQEDGGGERTHFDPPPRLSPDPNGPAVPAQMTAMKGLTRSGFDVAAYVMKEYGKSIPDLTFAEAASTIRAGQKK